MNIKGIKIEHNRKLFYIILALIVLLGFVVYFAVNQGKVIGGDKDEHGCLIAAGYSWNETKQKCVREWEETAKTYCTEESRNADVCPALYAPVCGNAFELNSTPQTSSNSCVACANKTIGYYLNGECSL